MRFSDEQRLLAATSPAGLALATSNGRWRLTRHLDAIDKLIVDAVAGRAPDRLIISVPPRHGKALALDTPIPTPDGWSTIGDLAVGDRVFDERGQPCTVVAKSPVWVGRPCFAVTTNDGDRIIADAEHEWLVSLDRRTRDHIHTTRTLAKPRSKRAMIRSPAPLQTPPAALPVDPYVLGVWLGDGASRHATISAHDDDAQWLRGEIEAAGYPTSDRATHATFGVLGLLAKLRTLGVLGNKHVPAAYLRAAPEQRLALLQGLIDTDGHVAPDGQVEFCTTTPQLAWAVRELVYSLGCKASLVEGRATIDGRDCGSKWRVMFYLAAAARMPRKAARCRNSPQRANRYVTAQPCASVPVQCIQVDSPSSLFLCGRSMLPTHNSELISRHTPPWYLGNFPDRRVMLASYEARFAESWGRKGRDLLEEHGQQLYGVRVRPDARAAAAWDIDGHEGGMVTGGVGGPFTGKGADLLIIDDPVKNAEEADSETIRDKHWDWWQSTASTRLHPGAVVIVVMTRWHEDDLAGRLLAGLDDEDERGSEWHEVRFPALAEAGDVLGREEGQALWPERFDEAWMARKKREVGSRWFNALYQGRPTAEEGDIFKRQWWRFYPPPDDVPLDQTLEPKRVWTTWDTALKDKTKSDYSVGIAWAQDGPNRYLLRVVRGRWGFTELLAQMTALAAWLGERWPGLTASHYVEAAAMGPELMAAARQRIPGVAAMTASVDKVARANAVTPFLEGGNVFLPGYRAADGQGYDPARTPAVVQDLIEECSAFPNGAHDDQVDALVYGIDPRRWVSGARRSRNEVAEERRRRNRPITGGLGGDY